MVLPSDETNEHNEPSEGHDEEMHVSNTAYSCQFNWITLGKTDTSRQLYGSRSKKQQEMSQNVQLK